VTGGTDNHLILWDLRPLGITGGKVRARGARRGARARGGARRGDWRPCPRPRRPRLPPNRARAPPSPDTPLHPCAQTPTLRQMEKACELCHITLNKNSVLGDTSAFTPGGVRIGTPAMTSRGLVEKDWEAVADFLHEVVQVRPLPFGLPSPGKPWPGAPAPAIRTRPRTRPSARRA
jgi:hypothetical protein